MITRGRVNAGYFLANARGQRLYAGSALKAFVMSGNGMEVRVILQPWGFVAAVVASRWDVRWPV